MWYLCTLGQVWYLIVSIPELCRLSNFQMGIYFFIFSYLSAHLFLFFLSVQRNDTWQDNKEVKPTFVLVLLHVAPGRNCKGHKHYVTIQCPEVLKIFMLNSTEHEISTAH